MSIRLIDLHKIYHTKTPEEALVIANLGAEVYEKTQSNLYKEWSLHQTAEEKVKAELYRKEGGAQMLESLKPKLLAGDVATARIETLNASIETEVTRRIKGEIEKQTLILEVNRVAPLQQRLSQLESKDELIQLLRDQTTHLTEKLQSKEERIQELESKNKQSSHAIGKEGEQTVLAMIKDYILPIFPFSRVEDKTGVEHAADFHLWTMPTPKKTVKMLIDSKKYKTPIKMVEIKKLHSDVDGDEEADGGIMLSLDSGIYNYSQFELSRTSKGKTILYMSMEGQSEEERRRTLQWGVRVMTSIGGEERGKQERKKEEVEELMKELEKSVKEQDQCVRQCAKTLEQMRATREGLYTRLMDYREGRLGLSGVKSEELSGVLSGELSGELSGGSSGGSKKCKWENTEGKKCGYKPSAGKDTCKRHSGGE